MTRTTQPGTFESFKAMKEALEGLFEQCTMVHKHWGEGGNQKEADQAIEAARHALTIAQGKEPTP